MSEELTRADVARLLGIAASTWGSYVSRGQAPAPGRHVGGTPVWTREQIDQWQRRRPGRGGPGIPRRTSATSPSPTRRVPMSTPTVDSRGPLGLSPAELRSLARVAEARASETRRFAADYDGIPADRWEQIAHLLDSAAE